MLFTRRLFITLALMLPFAGISTAADDKEYLTTYIVAVVPEGTPDVYITGNIEQFGPWWEKKAIMHREGSLRIYKMEVPKNFRMEYKFTLGDWDHEAAKENGRKFDNFKMKVTKNDQVFQHQVFGWTGKWKEKFGVAEE